MLRATRIGWSTHVFSVQRYLPSSTFTSIRHLTLSMPYELQEELADNHGSLLSFLKSHPTDFETNRLPDGTWQARSVAPSIDRLASNVGRFATREVTTQGMHKGPRVVGRRSTPADLVAAPAWSFYGFNERHMASALDFYAEENRSLSDRILRDLLDNDRRLIQHPKTGLLWVRASKRSSGAQCPILQCPDASVSARNGTVAVPAYDTLRLARLLSNEAYSPLVALEEVGAQYLTTPVCSIVFSIPERFDIETCEVDEKLLGHPVVNRMELQGHEWNNAAISDIATGNVVVGSEGVGMFQKFIVDEIYRRCLPAFNVRMGTGVRYKNVKLVGRSGKLSKMSDTEMDAYLEDMRLRKKKRRALSFTADRRAVRKEKLQREYPQGSPFFDDDVTAQFVYDLLQDFSPRMQLSEVLKIVEETGMPVFPLGGSFFTRFPHLFCVDEPVAGLIYISRRSDTANDTSAALTVEKAVAELAMAVCYSVATHEDPVTVYPTTISFSLRRDVRASINMHFGSIVNALQAFPQYFTEVKRHHDIIFSSTHAFVNAFAQECSAKLDKKEL